MCGIVGVVSKNDPFPVTYEHVFEDMLYVDAVRGEDSTGVILVDKDTTFHVAKEASPPAWFIPQLLQLSSYKKMWTNGKAAIGHNRKKTIGKIEDATAHPFVVNNEFAMVHNGTLTNHRDLASTEVDSEALAIVLYEAFENIDYKEDVETVLGKVNGAYAVAMYDQRHNKVRLLRNKERPLSYIETPKGVFFASEAPMLYWVLTRNSVPLSECKLQIVPEHTVIEIDLDTGNVEKTEITPKKPTPPTVVTSTSTAVTTNKGGFHYKKSTPVTTGMSKNLFKRLRKRWLNKKIEWWSEDYVEQYFPRTEEDGETSFWLMGSSDTITEQHIIRAVVDIKELHISKGELLIDCFWTGLVVFMEYDKATRQVYFYVEDAVPVANSYQKPAAEIVDAKYIQRKLDEQEKALVTLH